jgi:hypothetical protein
LLIFQKRQPGKDGLPLFLFNFKSTICHISMFPRPLYAILLVVSACRPTAKDPAALLPVYDTAIVPAVDSGIVAVPYDRVADSLRTVHLRDSFYARPTVKRFVTDVQGNALLKLAAWCTDTLPVHRTTLVFTEKEDRLYNKEQLPIQIKYTYRHPAYTITLTNNRPDEYHTRNITINGKPVRPGIELDVSLMGEEWIQHLSLDNTGFTELTIGGQKWLLLEGGIEKCNGIGCGVRYFILYDPLQKRGVAVQQFRMEFLIIGYNKISKQPELVVMDDADYNAFLQLKNCSGTLYTITPSGKIKAVRDRHALPRNFVGYYPYNDKDTSEYICIRQHNMRK